MITIGIISPPTLGHVNPFLILGRQLIKKGYRVVFFQLEEIKDHILNAGLEYHQIGKLIPKNVMQNMQKELGQLSGLDAMQYWKNRQVALFKVWFTELPRAIEKEAVNMLLIDQSDGVGGTIAEAKNIPYVTIAMGLNLDWEKNIPPFFLSRDYDLSDFTVHYNKRAMDEFIKDFKPLFDVINEKRKEYELELYNPYKNMYPVSPYAQIAQMPSFLDYPRVEKPSIFSSVGPFIDDSPQEIPFPFEKMNGKPLVYISLGTILNFRADIFNLVGGSFDDVDVQLVISLGNKEVDIDINSLPKDTIIVNYAPQRKILAHAKLCISHGGLNTVMDALASGVPLIIIPISFDQPGTAGRVRYHKIGEYIHFKSLSKRTVNKVVKKIINDRSYYENVQVMKEKFELLNGRDKAITIIEKIINEHVR